MSRIVISFAACILTVFAAPVSAAIIFTDSGSFLNLVQPVRFLNAFSSGGVPNPVAAVPSIDYTGSGFSYTVTAEGGLYVDNATIGNWVAAFPVVFNFTGNPVTAIGGNFYLTNIGGTLQNNLPVTIQLSDGTIETFIASTADEYRGFISTGPAITSMTLTPPTPFTDRFYNVDNLTVGTAVPEPTTIGLIATAGAIALVARRRRLSRS